MKTEEFRNQLKLLGWSQATLAGRLACDADTVSRWATGRTDVPGHVVEYLRVMALAREMVRP